jgi:hypothetical protein
VGQWVLWLEELLVEMEQEINVPLWRVELSMGT